VSESINPDGGEMYDKIAQAVRDSTSLQELLRSSTQDFGRAVQTQPVRKLLSALESQTPAERWVSDPELASLLPIVLRFSDRQETRDWNCAQLRGLMTQPENRRLLFLRQWSYPLFVAALSIGALVVLSLTIIPIFGKMFQDFELRLPRATQWIMAISDALSGRDPRSLIIFLAILGVLWFLAGGFGWLLHRWQSISFFGYWIAGSRCQLSAMARWTSTLAELLAIDVPLSESLRIAGIASKHPFYRSQSKLLSIASVNGVSPLATSPIARSFSSTALHALTAAHDGKPSIPLLRQIADIYWERCERSRSSGNGWLGPLAIFCLGFIVGFVVLALFMPLISLVTSLSS
jgi:type II secretory pathway component PulF